MTDPTGINSNNYISPYRLTLDVGPSWMHPSDGTSSLPGFTLGARLGQSYALSENWKWALQGVFSYSNYYADHGSLSRVAFGFETGPEYQLAPPYLSAALYVGVQEAFYYSREVSWNTLGARTSFDNEAVTALTLRPSLQWFRGILTTDFEFAHDFGLTVPSPLPYGVPTGAEINRFSFLLSVDILKAFSTAQNSISEFDDFDQFIRGIQVSGLVEGSYNYSFNDPRGRGALPGTNPYRTNHPYHNRPRLNLMEVALERPSSPRSPLGFRIDANFGQDPISFAPKSSLIEPVIGSEGGADTQYFALQQAYLTYRFPVLQGFTFQAGQFATTVGNEYPEGPLNPFLTPTRGFLNTLAEPFYHAGALLRMRYSENKNDEDEVENYTEGILGVVNGWDSVLGHEGGPTLMLGFNHQVNLRFTYALNYLIGAEGRGAQGLLNFNATWKPEDEWALGTNLNLGHGNDSDTGEGTLWFGLGLYQQYAPASWFNLVAREEIFTDPDGARTNISQTLLSGTLAANFVLPYGFGIGPEIRHDHSVGREASVPGPFQSGIDSADGNTTFTLRTFWKYPFQ